MYALALLFFRVIYGKLLNKETQDQFVAGAVILCGAPCTAMAFVWSTLVNGNAAYTLVQVSVNDILLLILYAPTLFLLLHSSLRRTVLRSWTRGEIIDLHDPCSRFLRLLRASTQGHSEV
jgi:ACR3 family arsenite efflux pump ArsB